MSSRKSFMQQLRRRMDTFQRLLNATSDELPGQLVAFNVKLIFDAAVGVAGKQLYEELAEAHIRKVRTEHALCHRCECAIPVEQSHPPQCEQCDAEDRDYAEKMDKELEGK